MYIQLILLQRRHLVGCLREDWSKTSYILFFKLNDLNMALDPQALLRELEQYQNEKRKALMNHEASKMKAIEERYSAELKEWRATLADRKTVSDTSNTTHCIYISKWLWGYMLKDIHTYKYIYASYIRIHKDFILFYMSMFKDRRTYVNCHDCMTVSMNVVTF